MYVYEKRTNKKPLCYWIENEIRDIQIRLEDYAESNDLYPLWVCHELPERPIEESSEYEKAEWSAIDDYRIEGGSFPCTVYAFPGRIPEDTFRVLNEDDSADISNLLELLDEWAAFSNEFDIRPFYFLDAEEEWGIAYKAGNIEMAKAISAAADLRPFVIRDREAGNAIESFISLQDAKDALDFSELADKEEGTYTPDFYEIYNSITKEIEG